MHPTLRLCSSRVRKPLIQFVGKRKWPSKPEPPHAHPAAPAELKKAFPEFVRKFQASASASGSSRVSASAPMPAAGASSAGKSGNVAVYEEFWQAPTRLWEQHIEEAEIEAVMSGGASLK